MKIIGLIAENVKRLTAVEITPTGALVEITGENGAGKTSTLDAIWWALAGAKHIQAAPIRKGAKEALIRLDLGDDGKIEYRVTRTFSRKSDEEITTTLRVESTNGAVFPKGQTGILEPLLGELTFDPLAFMEKDPKDKLLALRRFVPDVDFDEIDRAEKGDRDDRTEVNRRAKALRAQAAGIEVPIGTPDEPVDVSALVGDLEKAGETNTDIERRKARRESAAADIATARATAKRDRDRAAELREQAIVMDRQAADQEAHADSLQAKLDAAEPLPDPVDTAEVRRKIEEGRTLNDRVAAKKRRANIEAEAKALEIQSEALTKVIDDRRAKAAAAVEAAKMPIDGLGFGEDGVLLNGVPIEQASHAEQLRASIALAMAMNPRLKVMLVRDGSLLGTKSMKLVAEMAEANGYQVWCETVESSRPGAIVIEDGRVSHVVGAA